MPEIDRRIAAFAEAIQKHVELGGKVTAGAVRSCAQTARVQMVPAPLPLMQVRPPQFSPAPKTPKREKPKGRYG